jgi:two-component system response regulator DevR
MVVDDHDIVRRGLVSLISRREDFQVVGEASGASEAVARARELSPDVIVMDIRMPDGSGIEACRDIRAANPAVKVLFLTSYSDEEAVVGNILTKLEVSRRSQAAAFVAERQAKKKFSA